MDDESNLWAHRQDVHTIVFNHAEQRQLAVLNGAIWPPVGSVIELGKPNRDCVVTGVRLMIVPGAEQASIVVDVNVGDPDDFIPRHAADRMLSEDVEPDADTRL